MSTGEKKTTCINISFSFSGWCERAPLDMFRAFKIYNTVFLVKPKCCSRSSANERESRSKEVGQNMYYTRKKCDWIDVPPASEEGRKKKEPRRCGPCSRDPPRKGEKRSEEGEEGKTFMRGRGFKKVAEK